LEEVTGLVSEGAGGRRRQFGLSSTSYILCGGKLLDFFVKVLEEETSFWIVFNELCSLWGKVTGLVSKGAGGGDCILDSLLRVLFSSWESY
jgi:hypothetical protein